MFYQPPATDHLSPLKLESVRHLRGNLPRIRKVGSAEGIAVIEHVMVVRKIQPCQAQRKFLAKRFCQSQIEAGVIGQMRWRNVSVTVQKSGTIVQTEIGRASPRQIKIEPCGECISLVVVEEAQGVARVAADEPSGYVTRPFRVLVRIREMKLRPAGNLGRVRRRLPSADARVRQREREKHV